MDIKDLLDSFEEKTYTKESIEESVRNLLKTNHWKLRALLYQLDCNEKKIVDCFQEKDLKKRADLIAQEILKILQARSS